MICQVKFTDSAGVIWAVVCASDADTSGICSIYYSDPSVVSACSGSRRLVMRRFLDNGNCQSGACPLCVENCVCCQQTQVQNNCFPGDATVLTPGGVSYIKDVTVGDMVATVDKHGGVVFEPVYFQGHSEVHVMASFVQITVYPQALVGQDAGAFNKSYSSSSALKLELTSRHFLQVLQ